jgi:transcriptional regulator with XRE-family HTH domain/mannose-6-phosphate isomerase-like protein (cupin superfamily)
MTVETPGSDRPGLRLDPWPASPKTRRPVPERRGPLPDDRGFAAEPMENLAERLKRARQKAGLSLREVSRQLDISASFLSQIENGKSTPSVATLYSMAQLLGVTIDELFSGEQADAASAQSGAGSEDPHSPPVSSDILDGGPISRSALGSPADAWPSDEVRSRISVTRPGGRKRLEMDTGVVWEQLATNTGAELDFMWIFYPPHSTSTNDKRMLQHSGSEFGYLLDGELEVTVGFEVFTLRAGDAIGFDSSTPHLLTNKTDRPARGIWFVRHPHI